MIVTTFDPESSLLSSIHIPLPVVSPTPVLQTTSQLSKDLGVDASIFPIPTS